MVSHSEKDLVELMESVDEEFTAIQARQGAHMQCRAGCSDCCRARLSITRVEEQFLRTGADRMPASERHELARRAKDPKREMCPALDPDGRCGLYELRPLICRSFGVPLRHRREVALVNPPVVDVCDLNFVEIRLDALRDEDVVEQTDLEAKLRAIDDAYCDERGLPKGERVALAQILASLDETV